MAKVDPKISPDSNTEDSSFEMIELLSEDLDALARAFDLIAEVCDEGMTDGEEETAPVVIH